MYTLVLVRHGQSEWNLDNRFTGWTDVDLSEQGEQEARDAAALMLEARLSFDVCYTSLLKRAIRTLDIVLEHMDLLWLPVYKSWRLNERHYGGLQGLNKSETAEKYGKEQVFLWRRSYDVPPPPLTRDDIRFPGHDRRYASLHAADIPCAESLKNTVDRVLPYWLEAIVPTIRAGQRVLIAAHGNSLRALVKHLDGLDEKTVSELNIPTGIPLVYELDNELKPLQRRYLGDQQAAEAKAAAVAAQATQPVA